MLYANPAVDIALIVGGMATELLIQVGVVG